MGELLPGRESASVENSRQNKGTAWHWEWDAAALAFESSCEPLLKALAAGFFPQPSKIGPSPVRACSRWVQQLPAAGMFYIWLWRGRDVDVKPAGP